MNLRPVTFLGSWCAIPAIGGLGLLTDGGIYHDGGPEVMTTYIAAATSERCPTTDVMDNVAQTRLHSPVNCSIGALTHNSAIRTFRRLLPQRAIP